MHPMLPASTAEIHERDPRLSRLVLSIPLGPLLSGSIRFVEIAR
jgi:hypothetical protein